MLISLNWLKKYVDINVPTAKLAELIGARLVEIEEVHDNTDKYDGVKIVRIAEAKPIEGTHLTLCQIDAGDKDLIQVVCGAPNVKVGNFAAWIMPGATVPSTYGTSQPFVLDVRKIRGFESNGMLAAIDELGLGIDHEGILELDASVAEPGTPFAEVFAVNDVILDIENKSLTHRPDCFGIIGFAREIAGILGQKFNEPEIMNGKVEFDDELNIVIEDAELCPRYSAAVLDNFVDQPTGGLTAETYYLYASGMRPISQVVDVTNLLMLETGQPLHAFDYDKFIKVGGTDEPKIIVRAAKDGEEMELLDGKTIKMTTNDIVITSNNIPVALAGAMGGANTTIDKDTKRIIIESATFSLYNERKTSMYHGIFSEAVTRFTKGQPPALTEPVLAEAIRILSDDYGMKLVHTADAYPVTQPTPVVKITTLEINALLGTNYDEKLIRSTLENVGFTVDNEFNVTAPFWRTDIHIPEDIIEEVGRLLGYDNIPVTMPTRPFIAAEIDPLLAIKTRIRSHLSALGANELLTYSFVHGSLLEKVDLDSANSYQLANSLSPDLEYIRQSIIPSLLEKVFPNIKAGYDRFDIFEMNKTTERADGLNDEGVPIENDHLAYIATSDYYHVKFILDHLASKLGLVFSYHSVEKSIISMPFEPKRSATVYLDKKPIGVIGEIKAAVRAKLKLPEKAAGFEIDLADIIEKSATIKPRITEPYKYPSVERDLTIRLKAETAYTEVETVLRKVSESNTVIIDFTPISIYQGEDTTHKNLTFHLSLTHPDKTLASSDANDIINTINKELSSSLGAETV